MQNARQSFLPLTKAKLGKSLYGVISRHNGTFLKPHPMICWQLGFISFSSVLVLVEFFLTLQDFFTGTGAILQLWFPKSILDNSGKLVFVMNLLYTHIKSASKLYAHIHISWDMLYFAIRFWLLAGWSVSRTLLLLTLFQYDTFCWMYLNLLLSIGLYFFSQMAPRRALHRSSYHVREVNR